MARSTYLVVAAVAAAACVLCLALVSFKDAEADRADELLLKAHLEAHEPYSPPANMYLWWGPQTNHRFTGSGEHIRHLFHFGNIEGGEWRDPMFLGNNGVATFRSQRFRRISNACCSTILIPPMEWGFPVYNTHKMIGQRIRNFVANGNMLVLTGGILAMEFINSYFFYNIELADGNYSPGPYRRLKDVPEQFLAAPSVLPQKGISVTAVKKESLPSGTEVLWGTPRSSPVFMIKFCEAENPNEGMPPTKVLPRDCPAAEKDGRPCSCGYVMYIGYNYEEPYPTRWDKVARAAVEILNPAYVSPTAAKGNWQDLKVDKEHSEESRGRDEGEDTKLSRKDQTIKMQQEEIQSLEKEVQAIEEHEEHKTQKAEAKKARIVQLAEEPSAPEDEEEDGHKSMAQLKQEAIHLLAEVKARQQAKAKAEGGSAPMHKDDKLLMNSVLSLAQDMHKMDDKVDSLAMDVHKQGEEFEKIRHGGSDERRSRRSRGRRESGDRSLRQKLREYKKKARAYKQELSYEQSVPTPEYSYAEADHTTPLFAKGVHTAGCGTLCRLRSLVKKTRSNISKELSAALH